MMPKAVAKLYINYDRNCYTGEVIGVDGKRKWLVSNLPAVVDFLSDHGIDPEQVLDSVEEMLSKGRNIAYFSQEGLLIMTLRVPFPVFSS